MFMVGIHEIMHGMGFSGHFFQNFMPNGEEH